MTPRINMRAYLFLGILATTSAFSVSYLPQAKGRKLFGGYRIVPKVCQPTHPSRIVSDEPAMCMFNYECTRRNGDVVGACMDGFLFGACCQLPAKHSGGSTYEAGPSTGGFQNVYEVDHVPDIPILLNPDGTPMGMVMGNGKPTLTDILVPGDNTNTKISTFEPSTPTFHYADGNTNSDKTRVPQVDVTHIESDFPALLQQQSILDDLQLPGLITHSDSNNDIQDHQDAENAGTVTTLLNPDQVLQISDPVDQLPALFAQGVNHHDHSSADTILLNESGGMLNENNNPDDLFTPGSISTSKPSAVTNGHGSVTRTPPSPTTMHKIEQVTNKVESLTQESLSGMGYSPMLSGNGQDVTSVSYELYSLPSRTPRPTEKAPTSSYSDNVSWKASSKNPSSGEYSMTSTNEVTSDKSTKYISTMNNVVTTPMSPTTKGGDDELIRVPTITYDAQSGNKKHDVLDHEENSINHIISLLNNTDPSPEPEPFPEPNPHPDPNDDNSGIQTWISIDGTSVGPPEIKLPSTRPSPRPDATTVTFPYTFYKPNKPSVYYDYEITQETENPAMVSMNTYPPIVSTQGSYGGGGSSTQNIYSNRPSTNPPAPTVIVLGPLGTEYITKVDQNTPPRRPTPTMDPNVGSKKPAAAFSTTITHNINTVISTGNAEANNTRVVSSSYISVDLKDGAANGGNPVIVKKETTSSPVGTAGTVRPVAHEEIGTKRPEETVYQEIDTKRPPTSSVTVSMWSEKPTFNLKPSYAGVTTGSVAWPEDAVIAHNPIIFKDPIFVSTGGSATPVSPEDETTAPDEFNNFPPVRNPNLNMSGPASQQEKPTVVETFNNTFYPDILMIDENEIPTPAFVEDDALGNKVDGFVNKIVESLQDNFDDLNNVVYKKKNGTTTSPTQPTVTRKPTTSGVTTKRPIRRPAVTPASQTPTKNPNPTKRPPTRLSTTTQKTATVSGKPTRPLRVSTPRPKPTVQSTPTVGTSQTVTKRPKPVRKPTVPTTLSTAADPTVTERPVVSSTEVIHAGQKPSFRRDCGVRPLVKTGRIVGGKAAKFGEWPWQVLVREATWLGLFTKNKCGGVLITKQYVMTAAHCQPGFLASLVAVFGEFDITGELETKRSVSRNVKRVIVHKEYDPATFENDLALLELESPVQFDSHIVPICMPEDKADFTGRMATVTGWGRLKYNGGVPSVLQEVQVPIMENSVCQEMFQTTGHSKRILESFLCAGYANGQKDSCEGDSGGPLMLERPDGRWELAGTVSHGIKCAAPYLPGVYMRTTYFKPWLHGITGV